jgi:hypothetical protein
MAWILLHSKKRFVVPAAPHARRMNRAGAWFKEGGTLGKPHNIVVRTDPGVFGATPSS